VKRCGRSPSRGVHRYSWRRSPGLPYRPSNRTRDPACSGRGHTACAALHVGSERRTLRWPGQGVCAPLARFIRHHIVLAHDELTGMACEPCTRLLLTPHLRLLRCSWRFRSSPSGQLAHIASWMSRLDCSPGRPSGLTGLTGSLQKWFGGTSLSFVCRRLSSVITVLRPAAS
jgi:hypothetical protein